MNAPDPLARESFASLLARAREPFPASRKQYLAGALHADLRVPVRDIALTNGEQVSVLGRTLTDGYEDIKDSDFDLVRDMAKRTNMPPYQEY